MTMQALCKAGVHIGDNLIGPNPFNVDGHFENTQIVALHDKQLAETNCDWLATDFAFSDRPVFSSKTKSTASSIVSSLSQQPVWGFKDPRSSLFLWDWQQQIPNVFVVVVFRHYLSCIQSMRIRAARELALNPSITNVEAKLWQRPSTGLQSWITYNQQLLAFCQSNPKSVLLVQQEAIVKGFPLIEHVNKLAKVDLSDTADTGIAPSKVSSSNKLPWPTKYVDSALIEKADELWNKLLELANTEPVQAPDFSAAQFPAQDWSGKIKARLSTIDFINNEHIEKPNVQPPLKLNPPLHEFDEQEIATHRARLRGSLKNPQVTPAAKLINQYADSTHTTYFGEMLLAEKAIVNLDYSKAKRILFDARKLEPKDGLEPYLHGLIEEHFGNLESSVEYFSAAVQSMPENLGFWLAQIRLLRQLERHREALITIDSALSVVGRNLQLEIQRSVLQDHLNELPSAIETLQRSLANWPGHLMVLNSLYKLMGKAGKKTDATQYFKRFGAEKIGQNPQYSADIEQLFSSMKSDTDKHHLWQFIESDLNQFFD